MITKYFELNEENDKTLTLFNSEVINNNVLINTDKTDLWYI